MGAKRYEDKKDQIVFNQSYLTKQALVNKIILPLKSKGCVDCHRVYIPEAMEFDHVRGEKRYAISLFPSLSLSSEDMLNFLKEELELCELCCSNCHRKRTISRYRYSARREHLENPLSKRLNAKSRYAYDYLTEKGCADCLSTDLMVLEFDHVKGLKVQNLSVMIRHNKYSLDEVKDEIDKCEVRCAVCHRIKTTSRQSGIETTEQEHFRNTGQLRCTCGKVKDNAATKCATCHHAMKFDANKYPTLEEIIIGVETYGWLPYAKTLNVSDNGLRKVARKLGADPLPRKKR